MPDLIRRASMSVVLEKKLFTYDEVAALPEGQYEIIDGVRKDMTPTGGVHSMLEYEISRLLGGYYGDVYRILVGEVGILIKKSPLRLRAADIACISRGKMKSVPTGILETAPELVVEIVSESNAHWELTDKVKDYFSIGVERVVIVDPITATVNVYRRGAREILFYGFDEDAELAPGLMVRLSDFLK
jgi:Uma2 family endonuclease